MARAFYVYILASETRELYVGITNNLARRLVQHRDGTDPYRYVFRHATTRLVHVETAGEARDAIQREKQLKGWTRRRKLALIEETNPAWDDLTVAWRIL
ncbi:MAG: GIY-YIG nuclease family protein [Gemmatimonadota bacterium]|nr:GIY-YIG nuclease family protein [Gemmatimonadales bacterium]MDQ3138354.1 GIY-YIG nuclease family protein [Gemmatimonadota bacterium]